MNLAEARQTIETYLNTNWSHTPIVWENTDSYAFDGSQPFLPSGDAHYLHTSIRWNGTEPHAVPADGCKITEGVLSFRINIKKSIGTKYLEEYTDYLMGLFQSKPVSSVDGSVRFQNTSSTVEYNTTGWYVREVSFNFWFTYS